LTRLAPTMEALTAARRGRFARVAELTAGGFGPWLLALLALGMAYAAFAGGAIQIPEETRLQVGVAAAGGLAGVGVAVGGLRVPGAGLAWAAVALLAAFALWSALSVAWSASPDGAWIAGNRALAYAAIVAIALVAAASARRAALLTAAALAAIALAVALYALGGKLVPDVEIAGLSLDPGSQFARLREPIGYWNALALLCVMGTPVPIWLAAARGPSPALRIAAAVVLTVLLLTAALAYSRGAIVAYAAVLAVMVGAGPRRLPRLAVGLGAVVAAAPAMLVAFSRHDLSTGGIPLAERADDGAILALVLLLSLAALALLGRELIRLDARVRWTPQRSRMIWRWLAGAAVALVLAGAVGLASSSRGLTGEISHRIEQFKQPSTGDDNTPDRFVSGNGSNRWVWWMEALGAFSDKPLAGWGAGSYPLVRHLYRRYEAPATSAHSVPLQFLSETGLVGAALGLGGLALLGLAGVAGVRSSQGLERSARLALVAAAAAWGVHSLYDWDWEIPAVTLPALIAATVAAAPPMRASAVRPSAPRAPLLVAVGAALAAVAISASAALPSLSEGKRIDALRAAADGSLREAAEDAALARRLDPLAVDPLFTASTIAARRGRLREAATLLQKAATLEPDSAEVWERLAAIYLSLDAREAAVGALERLAEADPLTYGSEPGAVGGVLFQLEAPPSSSAGASGTPPPQRPGGRP
jgi:O-Antigen ligase/Tetratricopeptide repeat